jgi:Rieske Fe-S protein
VSRPSNASEILRSKTKKQDEKRKTKNEKRKTEHEGRKTRERRGKREAKTQGAEEERTGVRRGGPVRSGGRIMAEKVEDQGRRSFLGTFSVAAMAIAAGIFAYVGTGFLYPISRRKPPPLFVCLESQIPKGEPLEIQDLQGRRVLLMRDAREKLMAIGTVCTHLGCAVYYRPQRGLFECPCHQGFFDREGNPISGPPQRPLDRYPTEVREGKVFVQFG